MLFLLPTDARIGVDANYVGIVEKADSGYGSALRYIWCCCAALEENRVFCKWRL